MRLYFLTLGTLLIVCVGCASDGQQLLHKNEYVAPPAAMLANPGPMVGLSPGVMSVSSQVQPAAGAYPAACPADCPPGYGGYGGYGMEGPPRTSQIKFLGPDGVNIGWQIGPSFAESQVIAPGSYNFPQAATYRLKLAGIPGREGLVIYPSLQVYPTFPQTAAYLEHNAIPLRISDEDLDQVETNNHVTKVIYLPDAKYQDLAIAGVEELVSTRLLPGEDPVAEADRRGTIMAVLRMGNLDLEMPGQPLAAAGGPDAQVKLVSGEAGQFVAPVPIGGYIAGGSGSIPGAMVMGGPAGPGQPPYDPILGVNAPMWGYPVTSTPIGLPGPPHLPYGRPAGLQSLTLRNTSDYDVPGPVEHMLIDVRHEPGIRMPEPVKYIQYTEKHPMYQQGELSQPAWAGGQGGY